MGRAAVRGLSALSVLCGALGASWLFQHSLVRELDALSLLAGILANSRAGVGPVAAATATHCVCVVYGCYCPLL